MIKLMIRVSFTLAFSIIGMSGHADGFVLDESGEFTRIIFQDDIVSTVANSELENAFIIEFRDGTQDARLDPLANSGERIQSVEEISPNAVKIQLSCDCSFRSINMREIQVLENSIPRLSNLVWANSNNFERPFYIENAENSTLQKNHLNEVRYSSNNTETVENFEQTSEINGGNFPMGSCSSISYVDVADWPSSEVAIDEIASIRRELGQLDRDVDTSRGIDLAKSYLSLGMGVEAIHALGMSRQVADQASYLSSIGMIVDGVEVILGLDNYAYSCPATALWVVLDGTSQSLSAAREARKQFSIAPIGLQAAIGVRLADRFIDLGEVDAAGFVLRQLEDLPELYSGERALVSSRLAQADGFEAEAKSILSDVVNEDLDASPDALVELVTESLASGAVVNESQKALLGVFRSERQNTQVENDLILATLRTQIADGALSDGLSSVMEYEKLGRPTKFEMALDEFVYALVEEESDATFLSVSMELPSRLHRRVSPVLQAAISERFTDLGLAHLAADLQSLARDRFDQFQPETITHEGDFVTSEREEPLLASAQSDQAEANSGQSDVADTADFAVSASQINAGVQPGGLSRETQRSAATPLADAVTDTSSLLEQLDVLKSEIAEIGFDLRP